MSVYYKKKDGSIAKVAGHLTQRVNNRWFLCTRTLENGQEYYDVPDDQTKNYFEDISPFTIYAFGFAQPNTTTTPKLRYKSKVYDILDLTGIEGMSVGIAQLQGVFQMFTQESEQDMTMYFLGDLHKDYGIIQATATINQGDPSLPANVDVNVTKTEDGNILGFVFDNIKGQTGPQGEIGPQGEVGPQGPIGPTGLTALSYQQVIGDVPTEQEVLNLIPSAFNRTPQVGESIYVLAANRYFTLLTIQSVSTSEVTAIVVNVSDLQGPEGPKGDQGDAPNIVIEQINVNNTPVPVVNKTVSLTIPTAVSELNNDSNFATQEFVNSSIQAQAANFITPTAAGDTPWESFTALQTATTYYNAGVVVTLSNNDYAIFIKQEDDSHTFQWRAVYQNGQWMEQYKVGSVLTAAQQAAIDSGITSTLVAQINTNKSNISKLNTNLGNYLPLTGGNLSGKVKFTGTNFLSATNSQGNESNILSYDNTTNALKFGDTNWSKITVLNSLVPDTTNTKDLGATTLRYKDAYINGNIYTNGSIYKGTNNLQLPNKPGTVALISDITESAQTLTDAINSEATARENADNTLQETLDNKTTVNINNVLQSTINFDSDPQTQIDNIINNITKIANGIRSNGIDGGFSAGTDSSATWGGAVGYSAASEDGGSIGQYSQTTSGGAVGALTDSDTGFAGGYSSKSLDSGVAIGDTALAGYSSINQQYTGNKPITGVAIGSGAKTFIGVAIGYNAIAHAPEMNIGPGTPNVYDCIQLGTGTNNNSKTLQVYDDNIYDANTHTLTVRNATINGRDISKHIVNGADNGYIMKYDGTLICYGRHSASTGDDTVTLPYPFKDTNYKVAWGSESDNNQNVSARMISARNRTTSTFVNRFVSGNPMMYIAIGKWK